MRWLLVALVVSSIPSIAVADNVSSKYFRQACQKYLTRQQDRSPEAAMQAAECMAYMQAAYFQRRYDSANYGAPRYCLPANNTHELLAKTWISYIDEHPDMLNLVGAATFSMAMEAAFPCKK